jgi:hypothetical protein
MTVKLVLEALPKGPQLLRQCPKMPFIEPTHRCARKQRPKRRVGERTN